MGYIRHHAIVVTSTCGDIRRAHAKAVELLDRRTGAVEDEVVGRVIGPTINGTYSFLVGPDGSKEGWGASDEGDAFRAAFMEWLHAQRYDDDSTPLAWVCVQYGDDNLETKVVDDSDAPARNRVRTP